MTIKLGALGTAGASLVAMAALIGTATQAEAQDVPAVSPGQEGGFGSVPEIVVTATRREATAQSVPLALTAIGGDQLKDLGITNATELQQLAPSLVISSDVSGGSPRYSLRGLSNNDVKASANAAVTTYIDDVAQNSLFGIGASLFDLQRVEVLRGPQGTTFGKNTTGGLIAYVSQTPTNRMEGYVTGRLGMGYRDEQAIEAAINMPIVDEKLAARISVRAESQDDFLRNIGPTGGKVGGSNTFSLRGQLRWTPTTDTTANLTVYHARRRGDQPLARAAIGLGNRPDKDVVEFSSGYDYFDNFDNTAATLRVEHDFGNLSLTSITHYRDNKNDLSEDLDGTLYDLFYYWSQTKAEQYGQEIRLASDSAKPISGLVGLYYESSKVDERLASNASTQYGPYPGIALPQSRFPFVYANDPDGAGPIQRFDPVRAYDSLKSSLISERTKTYAIFGNLTVRPLDALSITGGLRKTIEKERNSAINVNFVSGVYDFSQRDVFVDLDAIPPNDGINQYAFRSKQEPLTWDITANYNPSRAFLLFGRIAKGYHAGGLNSAGGIFVWSPFRRPLTLIAPAPFTGESVISYEVGLKADVMRGLRVNANVFHYDYSNQQVSSFVNGALQTANAASSKVDGAEVEISAYPVRGLMLAGSISYVDARYSDYVVVRPGRPTEVYTGNRLNQAPEWSANGSISYSTAVSPTYDLRASTNWSYRSRIFFEQSNSRAQSDKERANGNLRLAFEPSGGSGFSIAAYVNNLTNTKPMNFVFAQAATEYYAKYYGIGTTYGLDVTYRW